MDRRALFAILLHYGIPDETVKAIRQLYDYSRGTVAVNGKLSPVFEISTGVLQGDVLAPFLFVIVVDYIMVNSQENHGFSTAHASASRVTRSQATAK